MKCFAASIFLALVCAAVAHSPSDIADDVRAVEKKSDDKKPIIESISTEPSSVHLGVEKLPVKIYYEAFCPDSRKLLNDVGMEYYIFRKYISLDFVPFGRAQSLDEDGNEFKCHHGRKECVANRVHSCGIKYLKSQDAKQQFVVCQMRQEADQTGKECLEEAGGEWSVVSKCVDGKEGKQLQLAAERETKKISYPKLENVPTIVFDDKYDSELNNRALEGLKVILCEMLSGKKIPDC